MNEAEALEATSALIELVRKKADAGGGIPPPPPIANGGRDGDNGGMEARIQSLEKSVQRIEERLRPIETDLAVIKSNYGTKADISDAKFQIIAWVVGAVFLAQLIPSFIGWLRSLP